MEFVDISKSCMFMMVHINFLNTLCISYSFSLLQLWRLLLTGSRAWVEMIGLTASYTSFQSVHGLSNLFAFSKKELLAPDGSVIICYERHVSLWSICNQLHQYTYYTLLFCHSNLDPMCYFDIHIVLLICLHCAIDMFTLCKIEIHHATCSL